MVQTHYGFDADVVRAIKRARSAGFALHAATYVNHPWPGWDGRSVDFWAGAGLGVPLDQKTGWRLFAFLLNDPKPPLVRHMIFRYTLWTPWAGYQSWEAEDHAGNMQHLHVTFQRR